MKNKTNAYTEKKQGQGKTPYLVIIVSALLGGISLLAWVGFNFYGAFGIIDLKMSESGKLLLNIGLSFTFFFQHSGMARNSFRSAIFKGIKKKYHTALFSIFSGVILFAVILLWQKSTYTIISLQGIYRWYFYIMFITAISGSLWGFASLGTPDMFGIRPIVYYIQQKEFKILPFSRRGSYRLVRHPLYFFCLVMIWSCPDITLDRLVYNLLWTAWIFTGSLYEERSLVNTYGDDYRNYQKRVPMVIPYKPWIYFTNSDKPVSDSSFTIDESTKRNHSFTEKTEYEQQDVLL